MLRNNDETYRCRVCGLKQNFQPWGIDGKTPAFEICGCCGVEFGYEDCDRSCVRKFRDEWLAKGGKWFISDEQPDDWSLQEEMKKIPKKYQ